jgi:ketosteroid isomerase-like protein
MSQENIEVVKRLYEAFQVGGLDAALEYLDPEILWEDLDALPGGGTYRGFDGLRQSLDRFSEAWGDLSLTAEELVDAGDAVVVAHRWRATGKSSGTPIDTVTWNVFWLRDGKVVRRRAFLERASAFDAAAASQG